MKSYDYAAVRYTHDISSGEFVNVGLAMWISEDAHFIHRVNHRLHRISEFFRPFEGNTYRKMLQLLSRRLDQTAEAFDGAGQLALFGSVPRSIEQLLVRILPRDESCFSWSPVMSGCVEYPDQRFDELYEEFVSQHDPVARERVTESKMWTRIKGELHRAGLESALDPDITVRNRLLGHNFRGRWNNGKPQYADAISLDYRDENEITRKALLWHGMLDTLCIDNDFQFTAVVCPPRIVNFRDAYKSALQIIRRSQPVRDVVEMGELAKLVNMIAHDAPKAKLD